MEAIAQHNFDATQGDELSFRQGEILKIRTIEDGGWYQAELNGKMGYVPSTYIKMEPHTWYKGNISRTEAECQLTTPTSHNLSHDGCFLVRDCQTDKNQFSLSVLHCGRPQHFKILCNYMGAYYLWPDKTFPSINKLIDYHRTISVAREPGSKIFLRDSAQPQMQQQVMQDDMYQAMYDFEPQSQDEVCFCRGNQIRVIDKSDPNWWTGEVLESGKQGFLPCNYIKKCSN